MSTIDKARQMLGQNVRVFLNKSDEYNPTIVTGILLGFGDGGDFEILEDDEFVHYCWPMLDIEPWPSPPVTLPEPSEATPSGAGGKPSSTVTEAGGDL